ncbi:MAG TPA: SDR family NAD(P)-dependent oxidoreductase [bacterium]|nr:SDR family NAD(P)-dependent oxidoreductase [bacterium]
MPPVIAVVGVGPGLGAAVAQRFAREGFAVALLARSQASLDATLPAVASQGAGKAPVLALPCDGTDAAAVRQAFQRIQKELGAPSVLVYNAGAFHRGGILELDPAQFEQSWRINCLGALLCAQQVLPAMLAAHAGTVLLTGATASLRGSAGFASLAVGKFGLRALAQSMARELGPQGIHVAHVVVDGVINTPRTRSFMPASRGDETFLAPEAIAETYWQLHAQPRSSWTLELDVRPNVEKF